ALPRLVVRVGGGGAAGVRLRRRLGLGAGVLDGLLLSVLASVGGALAVVGLLVGDAGGVDALGQLSDLTVPLGLGFGQRGCFPTDRVDDVGQRSEVVDLAGVDLAVVVALAEHVLRGLLQRVQVDVLAGVDGLGDEGADLADARVAGLLGLAG